MNKKSEVEWSNIDGTLLKAKRLHLEKDEADSCIIAQFKSAITNNFKVSVTGGNM